MRIGVGEVVMEIMKLICEASSMMERLQGMLTESWKTGELGAMKMML